MNSNESHEDLIEMKDLNHQDQDYRLMEPPPSASASLIVNPSESDSNLVSCSSTTDATANSSNDTTNQNLITSSSLLNSGKPEHSDTESLNKYQNNDLDGGDLSYARNSNNNQQQQQKYLETNKNSSSNIRRNHRKHHHHHRRSRTRGSSHRFRHRYSDSDQSTDGSDDSDDSDDYGSDDNDDSDDDSEGKNHDYRPRSHRRKSKNASTTGGQRAGGGGFSHHSSSGNWNSQTNNLLNDKNNESNQNDEMIRFNNNNHRSHHRQPFNHDRNSSNNRHTNNNNRNNRRYNNNSTNHNHRQPSYSSRDQHQRFNEQTKNNNHPHHHQQQHQYHQSGSSSSNIYQQLSTSSSAAAAAIGTPATNSGVPGVLYFPTTEPYNPEDAIFNQSLLNFRPPNLASVIGNSHGLNKQRHRQLVNVSLINEDNDDNVGDVGDTNNSDGKEPEQSMFQHGGDDSGVGQYSSINNDNIIQITTSKNNNLNNNAGMIYNNNHHNVNFNNNNNPYLPKRLDSSRIKNQNHHHNNRQSTVLLVQKIPIELNRIDVLNAHFQKYGNILDIRVGDGNDLDQDSALIQYSSNFEANRAYRSTEPVLNNRFIKVFWANREHRQQSHHDGNQPLNRHNPYGDNKRKSFLPSFVGTVSTDLPSTQQQETTMVQNVDIPAAMIHSYRSSNNRIIKPPSSNTEAIFNHHNHHQPATPPVAQQPKINLLSASARKRQLLLRQKLKQEYEECQKKLQEHLLNQKLLMNKCEATDNEQMRQNLKKLIKSNMKQFDELEARSSYISQLLIKTNNLLSSSTLSGGCSPSTSRVYINKNKYKKQKLNNNDSVVTTTTNSVNAVSADDSKDDIVEDLNVQPPPVDPMLLMETTDCMDGTDSEQLLMNDGAGQENHTEILMLEEEPQQLDYEA